MDVCRINHSQNNNHRKINIQNHQNTRSETRSPICVSLRFYYARTSFAIRAFAPRTSVKLGKHRRFRIVSDRVLLMISVLYFFSMFLCFSPLPSLLKKNISDNPLIQVFLCRSIFVPFWHCIAMYKLSNHEGWHFGFLKFLLIFVLYLYTSLKKLWGHPRKTVYNY